MFEFKMKSFKTFFIPDDASVFLQNSSIWDKKAGGGEQDSDGNGETRHSEEEEGVEGGGRKTYLEQIEY